MAMKALKKESNSSKESEEKDPLKEATDFTKQMAAGAIIDGQVAKVKAEAAKAQAEAREAVAKARKAEAGGGDSGGAGLQVKGKIDYGDVNLQAEREEYKKEAKDTLQLMGQKMDELEKAKKESDDKVHQIEMETLSKEIATLRADIKDGMGKKDFADQYEELIEKAKRLGLVKPETGGGNPILQLEIIKLQHDEAAREREFQRQLRRETREEKKEDRRYAEERALHQAELAEERRKNEQFANTFMTGARMVGRGMMESAGGAEAPVSSRANQHYELEVPVGQGGTAHCPECQTEVGVGPTARSAICANCNTKIFIKRVASEAESQDGIQGEEPLTTQKDLEE